MTSGNEILEEKEVKKLKEASVPERSAVKGKSPAASTGEPVQEFVARYESFKKHEAPAIATDEIRRVFDFFDENKDELISKDDLKLFMKKLGFDTTEEEISSMVSSVDVNRDGSVDFKEFASLYATLTSEELSNGASQVEEEDLKEAFNVFDKNGDGNISPSELQAVLVNLGMNEGRSLSNCEKMIHSVDVDGNGQVDFTEFKKLMSAEFGRG